MLERLKKDGYPTQPEQIVEQGWGTPAIPKELRGRVPLPEFTIATEFVGGGGGYGDPLDRDPEQVAQGVRRGLVAQRIAREVYGVVLRPRTLAVNRAGTEKRRAQVREERLRDGKPFSGKKSALPARLASARGWESVLRFHEYLEVARRGETQAIRCVVCGHLFCQAPGNYKLYALRRTRDFQELAQQGMPSGEPYIGAYHEYYCPGCATQLQVDAFCHLLPGAEEPLQDFWPKV
jgi:hypothetical protein